MSCHFFRASHKAWEKAWGSGRLDEVRKRGKESARETKESSEKRAKIVEMKREEVRNISSPVTF